MTTLRIFLSSTFHDMQEEREVLVRDTFLSLRDWAEKLGIHVAEVDLRWGVPEEMSALDVCLEEVDECRPLFLCFLGHVYGSLVTEHVLTEELRRRFPWLDGEGPVGRSYTELEIIHAVLRQDAPAMESLFYFRSTAASERVAQRLQREVPLDEQRKLEALKARIRAAHPPVRPDYDSAKKLGQWIEEDLKPLIEQRARLTRRGTPWCLRQGRCWAGDGGLLENLTATALRYWQPGWFQALGSGNRLQGIVLAGASGSGKSTLLAAWALLLHGEAPRLLCETGEASVSAVAPSLHRLQELAPRVLCLSADDCAAGDADGESPGWPRLARRLMEFIRDEWSPALAPPPESEPLRLLYALPEALEAIPKDEHLLLILDDPSAVRDRSRDDPLAWLPAKLPPQVWVSATAGAEGTQWVERRGWGMMHVPDRLPDKLMEQLLEARLREHGKRLGEADREAARALLQHAPPRWVGLVLADLRGMQESAALPLFKAVPLRIQALRAVAQEPATLGRPLLEALGERHGGELVWRTIALLMEARTGLLEMELRHLLSAADEPLPSAQWSPLYLGLRDWVRPTSGLLVPGPELRIAWQAWLAELPPKEIIRRKREAFVALVDFFMTRRGPNDARALEQVPWLYRQSPKLGTLLTHPDWLGALWRDRPGEVLALWRRLGNRALADGVALWRERHAQQSPNGWHALACASAELLPGTNTALEAARLARQLGCRAASLTEATELRRQGRGEEAAHVLEDLLRNPADGDGSLAAKAQLQLAEILQPEQPESATLLAREALTAAGSLREPALLMEACHFLGRFMLKQSKPAEALPFFEELQRVAGLVGSQRHLILALEGQGNATAFTTGSLERARSLLEDAVALAAAAGDSGLERGALGSLIDVLLRQTRWSQALLLLERRIESAHAADDMVDEAHTLWQQANLWRDSGLKPRSAIAAVLREAQNLALKSDASALASECRRMLELNGM